MGGNKAYVLFSLLAYEMRVIPPRFFSILLPGCMLQLLLLSITSVFFYLPESDAALWSALHARPPYVSMTSLKLFTECKKKKNCGEGRCNICLFSYSLRTNARLASRQPGTRSTVFRANLLGQCRKKAKLATASAVPQFLLTIGTQRTAFQLLSICLGSTGQRRRGCHCVGEQLLQLL